MDDSALKYLGERISRAGIPLVFMGVNNNPRVYFKDGNLPNNLAGILERPLVDANVRLIYKLLPPRAKHILMMMDAGPTSQAFVNSTLDGTTSVTLDDITLSVWMTENYSDWQAKVNLLHKQEYDALIIGSYANLRDINNQQVPDIEIAEWTSEHSMIPMFTFWSHGVGKRKSIGGVVISGYDQGAKSAEAVNSILLEDHYPFVEAPRNGDFLFSQSELARWNITLPHYLRRRADLIE